MPVSTLSHDDPDHEEAAQLYEGFAKHITTGLPFVLAKFAMSLDGKIATRTGDSKWVTGPQARGLVQKMRRETDAIMVGANTVLADDPQLTARDDDNQPLERQPIRVTLDSQCRMPVRSQLLRQPGQTLVYTTEAAPAGNVGGLLRAGADVVPVGTTSEGLVSPAEVLADLGKRGVVNLLVEGGGKTLGSLFDDRLMVTRCTPSWPPSSSAEWTQRRPWRERAPSSWRRPADWSALPSGRSETTGSSRDTPAGQADPVPLAGLPRNTQRPAACHTRRIRGEPHVYRNSRRSRFSRQHQRQRDDRTGR